MAVKTGFWVALGGAIVAVAGFAIWILRALLGGKSGSPPDKSISLDDARAREEERIRQEIKHETDQQLADRFNKLAGSGTTKEGKK